MILLSSNCKNKLAQEFFLFSKYIWYNWVSTSVGIGQAACRLGASFGDAIINPLIGLFLPVGDLDILSVHVPNLPAETTVFRIPEKNNPSYLLLISPVRNIIY